MKICGLNKTTLLDYPGKVAATIFIGGCNFRCPFCHNSSLVTNTASQPEISQTEILNFFKKRRGILEGVCVTGGEPTLFPELADFLSDIRELGYPIKLDTNGSNPSFLRFLVQNDLISKVAMDIKSSPQNYSKLTGITTLDFHAIETSVSYLLEENVDYEFRTTVVRELHNIQDFVEISQWIKGAKAYYLQAYKDSEEVLQPGFSSYSLEELEHFRTILQKTIPLVEIRGID